MECRRCKSKNSRIFTGEIAIHFPGPDGPTKPIVWVFPDLAICLSCGVAEFEVQKEQLGSLQQEASNAN